MEVYRTAQRIKSKRWDYACSNSSGTYPLGYCSGFPKPAEAGSTFEAMAKVSIERAEPFREKYHEDGHATSGEAVACYEGFLLDQRLRFFDDPTSQERCEVCDLWTQGRGDFTGTTRYTLLVLCKDHQAREHAEAALAKRKQKHKEKKDG